MKNYLVLLATVLSMLSVHASQQELKDLLLGKAPEDNYVVYPAFNASSTKPIYNYQQIVQEYNVNIITLTNPLDGHFSVLPPTTGCGTRQKTSVNADARGCVAATNAGFFNMDTGACIGNVISNGEVVQKTCDVRGNFGLLKNGSFVIGYLSCNTIEKLGFSQLVQGLVTLVRNGVSFVDQSDAIENAGDYFINLKAPRVGIGHDKQGRLLIVQVDGNEDKRIGFDLYEFANLMIQLGAVNAVNLDGGGSSTLLINKNQLKSQCMDSCGGSTETNLCPNAEDKYCERTVTTIICIS